MLKGMLNELKQMVGDYLPLTYLLLDGHFGNNYAMVMSQQVNLQLISKLRYDSALYFPLFVNSSIIDLKVFFRGYQYLAETMKILTEKPEPILLTQIFTSICSLGRIHPLSATSPPS